MMASCQERTWIPNITRIELQEAAKRLPQLLYPETILNSEEGVHSSSSGDCTRDEMKPATTSIESTKDFYTDSPVVVTKVIHRQSSDNKLMKDKLTIPLALSVFSPNIIPQLQHDVHVPEILISSEPPPTKHHMSPCTTHHTNEINHIMENSSIPKLPHIISHRKGHSLKPLIVKKHYYSNSRLTQKQNIPLQLHNIHQQLQHPIEDASRSVYPQPYRMVGWSSKTRRVFGHPFTRSNAINVTVSLISSSVLSYKEADTSMPPQKYVHQLAPVITSSLHCLPVTFDYLRKSSRRRDMLLKAATAKADTEVQQETKVERREDDKEILLPAEHESTPQEREENQEKIQSEVALLQLSKKTQDKSYLIHFNTEELDKKTMAIVNKFRGGVINTLDNLTGEIRNEYDVFLSEIDAVSYYSHRQVEELLQDYSPRIVVLISSAIPKAEVLKSATRPEVLSLVYDVTKETYTSLLKKLKALLDTYKVGAKAKCLAIICKGGPGYMYLLQRKPITPPKLLKDEELLKFWKTVGSCMSKTSLTEQSVIHLMECNVAGNRQGTELLNNLEAALYCHKVKALSPLELEPKGRAMIATYFFPEKFKHWKSRRYTS